METGNRPQHEKSEGISKRKQQTNMATLHSKLTSKDQGFKENIYKNTCNNKENVRQSVDQCVYQITEETIIK
jgi:DNA helicase TIP49 (TBP-interacting protein)